MSKIEDDAFSAWLDDADMPRVDSKGQWFDAETGLYFDRACTPAIAYNLLQYWGKRVSFREQKNGAIRISVSNSALSLLAERDIPRHIFNQRPRENNAQVEWACAKSGINIKD